MEPLIVLATLTIAPGARDRFRDFETQALRIAARHGARLERVIALDPSPGGLERETHLLVFPSRDAFAAYRADPALAALAGLRAACIAHTDVLTGVAGSLNPPAE